MAAAVAVAVLAGCGADSDADPRVGAAPPPPADAPAPVADTGSAPFAIVPDARPGTVRVRIRPGGRSTLRLRVANGGEDARTFALRTTSPWIRISPAVTVAARQSAVVTASVAPPPGAPPGHLDARVLARGRTPATGPITVDYESAVRVRVEVVAP